MNITSKMRVSAEMADTRRHLGNDVRNCSDRGLRRTDGRGGARAPRDDDSMPNGLRATQAGRRDGEVAWPLRGGECDLLGWSAE